MSFCMIQLKSMQPFELEHLRQEGITSSLCPTIEKKWKETMFTQSAAYYDAIYAANGKDYAQEATRLQAFIQTHQRSPGNHLLDVACGTGAHLAYLAQTYTVEGLDADATMLQVAQQKFPELPFHLGDMVDFDLGRTFDVVTCLFSSIGYVQTLARLQQAIGNFCRHTAPGGLVIVEPWFAPGVLQTGHVHAAFVDQPDLKLARMSVTEIEGALSILNFHYLIATQGEINHTTERHELGLFTHDDYVAAFQAHSLTPLYDEQGLTGRGLYIGQKPLLTLLDDQFAIRPATPADEPFLWEMLYQAIHIPEGKPQPDRTVLQEPTLAHYVADWGERTGDLGLVAVEKNSGEPVGAAWVRLFSNDDPGYGFIAADTPEVSMALQPAYRGQGIGTRLLTQLIELAASHYTALSLSVDPDNSAMRLYQRLGFEPVGMVGTSLTMRRSLSMPTINR